MISVYDDLNSCELEKLNLETAEKLLKEKHEFVARINYLGCDGKVGEVVYFINKKEYANEIKESYNIGRPISAKQRVMIEK